LHGESHVVDAILATRIPKDLVVHVARRFLRVEKSYKRHAFFLGRYFKLEFTVGVDKFELEKELVLRLRLS
jgi:hypothetical protein